MYVKEKACIGGYRAGLEKQRQCDYTPSCIARQSEAAAMVALDLMKMARQIKLLKSPETRRRQIRLLCQSLIALLRRA